MKEFSFKQVVVLILSIIAVIAFLGTTGPVWTFDFWRQFLLNLFLYVGVSAFVVILISSFNKNT